MRHNAGQWLAAWMLDCLVVFPGLCLFAVPT